jgi:hypothetical protein
MCKRNQLPFSWKFCRTLEILFLKLSNTVHRITRNCSFSFSQAQIVCGCKKKRSTYFYSSTFCKWKNLDLSKEFILFFRDHNETARIYAGAHTRTHHTQTHAQLHTNARTRARTRAHHVQTRTHTHGHPRTHTTHTHTRAHTHTHNTTHTCTHARARKHHSCIYRYVCQMAIWPKTALMCVVLRDTYVSVSISSSIFAVKILFLIVQVLTRAFLSQHRDV